MSGNTSATGGYLAPIPLPVVPLDDSDLQDFLQSVVVGITGLSPILVRPRWQVLPPQQPDPNITWCAVGILSQIPEDYPYEVHDPTGDGVDHTQRHERIESLASFYGPTSGSFARIFYDGFYIAQNREMLWANDFGLIEVGKTLHVPENIAAQWIDRYDVPFILRRQIRLTWPIMNVLSLDNTLHTETFSTAPSLITHTFALDESVLNGTDILP